MVDIVLILPGIVQVNVSIHAHVMCYSAQAFVVTMIFSHSNTSLTVYALAGTTESFLVVHAHVMCYSAQAFVVTMIFSHSNTSLTVYALAGTAESFLVGMEWTNKCVIQLCAASPCMTPGFDGLALLQVVCV